MPNAAYDIVAKKHHCAQTHECRNSVTNAMSKFAI